MNAARPRCTPGLRAYQCLMEKDRRARLANQRRLRELNRTRPAGSVLFCSTRGTIPPASRSAGTRLRRGPAGFTGPGSYPAVSVIPVAMTIVVMTVVVTAAVMRRAVRQCRGRGHAAGRSCDAGRDTGVVEPGLIRSGVLAQVQARFHHVVQRFPHCAGVDIEA